MQTPLHSQCRPPCIPNADPLAFPMQTPLHSNFDSRGGFTVYSECRPPCIRNADPLAFAMQTPLHSQCRPPCTPNADPKNEPKNDSKNDPKTTYTQSFPTCRDVAGLNGLSFCCRPNTGFGDSYYSECVWRPFYYSSYYSACVWRSFLLQFLARDVCVCGEASLEAGDPLCLPLSPAC